MKTLDTGPDKIKKICDILKRETLEPAKQEADKIVKEAQERAERMIEEAEKQAQKLIEDTRVMMEQERNVFLSSLTQASKQSVEALKQIIEQKLFNETIEETITKHTSDPKIIANLINAIVKAVEKEGLSTEISAIIPKTVSAEEVNRHLTKEVLAKLEKHSVVLGPITGGAQVKLIDKQLTLDITDKVLSDFLKHYVRKDFRKLIFIPAVG